MEDYKAIIELSLTAGVPKIFIPYDDDHMLIVSKKDLKITHVVIKPFGSLYDGWIIESPQCPFCLSNLYSYDQLIACKACNAVHNVEDAISANTDLSPLDDEYFDRLLDEE